MSASLPTRDIAATLSVPCGFTSAGLPLGLRIVGRPHEDLTVLRIGHYYQQASAWHTKRLPLTAL